MSSLISATPSTLTRIIGDLMFVPEVEGGLRGSHAKLILGIPQQFPRAGTIVTCDLNHDIAMARSVSR